METKPDIEVSITNNTFYPERIIFCIDISGEMNNILEFNDLPFPKYTEPNDFQTQQLSVPTSPMGSPMSSPKISFSEMVQHNMNNNNNNNNNNSNNNNNNSNNNINNNNSNSIYLINLKDNIPNSTSTNSISDVLNNNNINNNSNNQDSINKPINNDIYNTNTIISNTSTNNDVFNNGNNYIDNGYMAPIEKSSSIKDLAHSAKKLFKNKNNDENGSASDSRSSSPIKNLLKGNSNNDNSVNGSPDNGNRRSSLNFLKNSYSNVVQNVFNGNHSRASSNTSIGSVGSLNKDFPALKTPIELTRLEVVKRYIKRFVTLKGSLSREHQYAIVLLGVDAIWYNDFTSDYKNIINVMEEIPAQQENIREFDMDSLLNLIKERSLIPNVLTSNYYLRVVFLYSRPCIPTINLNNVILKQLKESKLFMFDCVYFHEKKNENFDPQAVFNELLKMEDPSHPSLFFDVIRNGQKFSISMMKLLGHPLQRRI
ncbi:hypothetical protein BCR32DRAFT_328450, partial [Anaeromyces robustus]